LAKATGDEIMDTNAGTSRGEMLTQLFRQVLTRYPTPAELELLSNYFDSQVQHFAQNSELASELLEIDPIEQDKAGDLGEQQELACRAAWTATARAVFGLDEAQMRD
jgi:hypothetical protein